MKRFLVLALIMLLMVGVSYATRPTLEKDDQGWAIQGALTPVTAHVISASVTTATNSTAFTYNVLRVISTANCFIAFGSSIVTSALTDHYLPADTVEYFSRKEHTHMAVILSAGTCSVYISEMK